MINEHAFSVFYTDRTGEQREIDAASLIIQFPNKQKIEITWDKHPNDPRPASIAVWGGLSPKVDWDEEMAKLHSSSLTILPSAGNLVLIHPNKNSA